MWDFFMKKQNQHFGYSHVYNRGVDKRPIFLNDKDRVKFLGCMQELCLNNEIRHATILAYCLMDNHYHFLVEQTRENGLAKFMHRLGTSYTMYFNKSYKRKGSLFESRYKATLIPEDRHLFHVFRYIHLNPIKFFKKAYIREVDNIEKAINFVYEYKWSNLKKAFSASKKSMHCDLLKNEFITKDAYNGFLSDWIKYGKPGSAIQ